MLTQGEIIRQEEMLEILKMINTNLQTIADTLGHISVTQKIKAEDKYLHNRGDL